MIYHEWRMYTEVAPYGDLWALIARYRYWRTFLPEAFLWHLFDSLAHAAEATTTSSPKGSLLGKNFQPGWTNIQLVNFDIKSANIMLGYPDHRTQIPGRPASAYGGSRVYAYPCIKMIDFGHTYHTCANDQTNPVQYFRYGTPMNKPPVSESLQIFIWICFGKEYAVCVVMTISF